MPIAIGQQIISNLPILALVVVFVLMTILPQRKRNKEVKKMMDAMKKGDWVKTIGGVTGKIVTVSDEYVVVETGPQHVQIQFTRGAIASVGDSPVEAEGLSETDVQVAIKADKKK